jgi:hypothetical protein
LRTASDTDILSQMPEERKKKNPAAVALGRLGGRKRAATLSAEELSEQGKRAAAARWAKSKTLEATPEVQGPSVARSEPEREPERVHASFDGHDSNAIQALRDQGYEVSEPAYHPDGALRVNVRSHDVAAWVTSGLELLDLAAGRVTLEAIKNRWRGERRSAAAGG